MIWWLIFASLLVIAGIAAISVRWYYLLVTSDAITVVFGPMRRSVSVMKITELRKRANRLNGFPYFELITKSGEPELRLSGFAFAEPQMKEVADRLAVPFDEKAQWGWGRLR